MSSVSDMVTSALSAIFSVSHMGILGYILLALSGIGVAILAVWLRNRAIAAAQAASQTQANSDDAKNQTDNQNISDNLDHVHDIINAVIKNSRKLK